MSIYNVVDAPYYPWNPPRLLPGSTYKAWCMYCATRTLALFTCTAPIILNTSQHLHTLSTARVGEGLLKVASETATFLVASMLYSHDFSFPVDVFQVFSSVRPFYSALFPDVVWGALAEDESGILARVSSRIRPIHVECH